MRKQAAFKMSHVTTFEEDITGYHRLDISIELAKSGVAAMHA